MYGVLYAVSPEIFATKDRGTGNGIVATANRIFGIMVGVHDQGSTLEKRKADILYFFN